MNPTIFNALRVAYLKVIQSTSYRGQTSGKLDINLDEREEIKNELVAPTLEGFVEYRAAFDDGVTPENESEIIIPFVERLETKFVELEQEFLNEVARLLNKYQDR